MSTQPSPQAKPLAMSAAGELLKIASIGSHPSHTRQIANMGLNPGVQIQVRQHEAGAVVICLGNTRYALGAAMAHCILVLPA